MTVSKKHNFLILNSASGLAERIVNLLLQVWLYQYLIKRITPEEYSLYPVVTALLVFIPPVMAVLTSGLARYAVEAYTRGDHLRITEITSTIFPVLLGAGLVLALLGTVLTRYLDHVLNIAPRQLSDARLMVLLLFGSLALRFILTPFGVGLYVCQRFVILNALNLLQTLFRLALLFALLLGVSARVIWVVVAGVTADMALMLIITGLSIWFLPALKFRPGRFRGDLLSKLLGFGVWNTVGSIALLIRKSSDFLILNRFATPVDVGAFHLASLPDNNIDNFIAKMNEPLQPHMVALHTGGQSTAMQDLYSRGGRYCMWAALIVTTPLIVFRQEIWSTYLGARLAVFAEIPLVMTLLLARYWLEGPVYYLGMVAYAMNRVRPLAILMMSQSILNVAITIYLVHSLHMGAVGSALGTLIAVIVWDPLVMWRFSLKLLGLRFATWCHATVWKGVLPAIMSALFALAWRHWMQPGTMAELLVAVAAITLVYILTLIAFCLDNDEAVFLNRLFLRISPQRAFKAVASRNEL